MLWLDGAINGAGRLSIMQGRAVAFNSMSWFNVDILSVKTRFVTVCLLEGG